MSTQSTRLDPNGKQIIGQHPLQYHLERHLEGSTWNLVLTFASRERAIVTTPTGTTNPEGFEVARFEDDGDGTSPRVYDGLGRPISLQPPARPAPPAVTGTSLSAAAVARTAIASAQALTRSGAVRPKTTDRDWVGFFVLSPEGRPGRAASLARQYGAAARTAAGLDRYIAHHDSVTVTVDADPELAAITSVVEEVGGTTRRRWTMTYDRALGGTATKNEVRVEAFAAGGSKGSRVKTTKFANVRVERRMGT